MGGTLSGPSVTVLRRDGEDDAGVSMGTEGGAMRYDRVW